MKIKYLRLNKKERKEARKDFFMTNTGKYVRSKIRSSILCAIMCIIFSAYLIIDAFINDMNILQKIYSFAIMFIGIALLIASYRIYIKKINEFVVKKK